MTISKEKLRDLIASVMEREIADDEVIEPSSLEMLEIFIALEDALEGRHEIPEDLNWRCLNDVVEWLESKGEFQGSKTS